MRLRFYAVAVLLLVSAAMLVESMLGKLYVRYMILFSGAIFACGHSPQRDQPEKTLDAVTSFLHQAN